MNENDIIPILLKEYDTLRAEILQRIGHRFAFLGLFGAVGTYAFFSAKKLASHQIVTLTVCAIFLFCVWYQLGNLIARCSKRIGEIEQTINSYTGKELLKWEHMKRGSKIFHVLHK